jgi:hypothetical protein
MMFDDCKNSKTKGSIGETRAIYEYTKKGYIVSKPLVDCVYDLILDDGNSLKKVQCKTTSQKRRNTYSCNLRVMGGNKSGNVVKKRQDGDYDVLFVLADSGECWSIPVTHFTAKNCLNLDFRFDNFKL